MPDPAIWSLPTAPTASTSSAFTFTRDARPDAYGSDSRMAGISTWSQPSILTRSLDRLDELAALSDDWDSYGGSRPTDASVRAARTLLLTVSITFGAALGRAVNPTHISPLPVGGVQLEWEGDQKDLEVEVGPDGGFAYLLVDRTEPTRRYTEGENTPAATIVGLVVSALVS